MTIGSTFGANRRARGEEPEPKREPTIYEADTALERHRRLMEKLYADEYMDD